MGRCLGLYVEAYAEVASVRDGIEAERNLQGFFMAYLYLSSYYITAPELELNHGYCDFFLLPDLTHYPTKHSYIIELKMLPAKDFEAKAEAQWQEAVEQINRYAAAPRIESCAKARHCIKSSSVCWMGNETNGRSINIHI